MFRLDLVAVWRDIFSFVGEEHPNLLKVTLKGFPAAVPVSVQFIRETFI
jgi:hypothetical protein